LNRNEKLAAALCPQQNHIFMHDAKATSVHGSWPARKLIPQDQLHVINRNRAVWHLVLVLTAEVSPRCGCGVASACVELVGDQCCPLTQRVRPCAERISGKSSALANRGVRPFGRVSICRGAQPTCGQARRVPRSIQQVSCPWAPAQRRRPLPSTNAEPSLTIPTPACRLSTEAEEIRHNHH